MAYRLSWVIYANCYPHRRTLVILFEPIAGGIRGFMLFSESISLKVNVILQLEFELAYNDLAVKHVNHNATGTHPNETLKSV